MGAETYVALRVAGWSTRAIVKWWSKNPYYRDYNRPYRSRVKATKRQSR